MNKPLGVVAGWAHLTVDKIVEEDAVVVPMMLGWSPGMNLQVLLNRDELVEPGGLNMTVQAVMRPAIGRFMPMAVALVVGCWNFPLSGTGLMASLPAPADADAVVVLAVSAYERHTSYRAKKRHADRGPTYGEWTDLPDMESKAGEVLQRSLRALLN